MDNFDWGMIEFIIIGLIFAIGLFIGIGIKNDNCEMFNCLKNKNNNVEYCEYINKLS